MPDEIGRTIRRDLDLLPVLPRERWLPPAPSTGARVRSGVFGAVVGVAAIALALALGTGLTQIRSEIGKGSGEATPASPATGTLSRQSVLARISQLTADVPTIIRIEAKLVDANQFRASGGPFHATPTASAPPSQSRWWIVAVSGDVRCSSCVTPAGPFHSAAYLVDPDTGEVRSMVAYQDYWPFGFESLGDLALAANSMTTRVTVEEIRLPNTVIVTTVDEVAIHQKGSRLTLQADENTAYAWSASPAGGTALSLEELVRSGRLTAGSTRISVTFADTPIGGSYRLEWLRTGIETN